MVSEDINKKMWKLKKKKKKQKKEKGSNSNTVYFFQDKTELSVITEQLSVISDELLVFS